MSNEEIRKLLGGYATNTLTDAERKALFEAALEDQELFDALQQEQPLRDLFSDPVSRAQVLEALGRPAQEQKSSWWSHWWAWGSAATAAAAAVFIVAVVRTNGPEVKQQLASLESPKTAQAPAPAPEAPSAKPAAPAKTQAKPRNSLDRPSNESRNFTPPVPAARSDDAARETKKDRDQEAANAPKPAPPPEPTAPPAQTAQRMAEQATPSPSAQQVQVPALPPAAGFRAQQGAPAGVAGGILADRLTAPLRYSLLKRDAAGAYVPVAADALNRGDAVRVVVTPAVSGIVTLSRLDSSGQWKAVAQPLLVSRNGSYTMPENPIEVQDREIKLRVSLAPVAAQTVTGAAVTKERAATLAKQAEAAGPYIDITLRAR